MTKYKASLGLGTGDKDLSDPNDPRDCLIISLALHSPGRDPVKLDLTSPGALEALKKQPFRIKEGAKYSIEVTFKVQHNILCGLQYLQTAKRAAISSKEREMIVRCPDIITAPFPTDIICRARMHPIQTRLLNMSNDVCFHRPLYLLPQMQCLLMQSSQRGRSP